MYLILVNIINHDNHEAIQEMLFWLFQIGLLCDLLWSEPDKSVTGWRDPDDAISFGFGVDVVNEVRSQTNSVL